MTIEYGYFWWRHHADASTFILLRDEEDNQWYMPGYETPVIHPERDATLLGAVPRTVVGGGSIDQ